MESVDKSVTLRQFAEWLIEIKPYTWDLSNFGTAELNYLIVKYITPSIDTRSYLVYGVKCHGGTGGTLEVHIGDKFEGNILDEMTRQIKTIADTIAKEADPNLPHATS